MVLLEGAEEVKFLNKWYVIGCGIIVLAWVLFFMSIAFAPMEMMMPCRTDNWMMHACGVTIQEYTQKAAENSTFCPPGQDIIRFHECGAPAVNWTLLSFYGLISFTVIYNLAYAAYFLYRKRKGK